MDEAPRHGGRDPRVHPGARRRAEGEGAALRLARDPRSAFVPASTALELYAFDPGAAAAQVAKLARLRRERDQVAVDRVLAGLRDAARGRDNLMPTVLEAVRAYATLGEMAGVLREVGGEHKEPLVF